MQAVARRLQSTLPSWDPATEPCDPEPLSNSSKWEGVQCEQGAVVGISLSYRGLVGTWAERVSILRLCPYPCALT